MVGSVSDRRTVQKARNRAPGGLAITADLKWLPTTRREAPQGLAPFRKCARRLNLPLCSFFHRFRIKQENGVLACDRHSDLIAKSRHPGHGMLLAQHGHRPGVTASTLPARKFALGRVACNAKPIFPRRWIVVLGILEASHLRHRDKNEPVSQRNPRPAAPPPAVQPLHHANRSPLAINASLPSALVPPAVRKN